MQLSTYGEYMKRLTAVIASLGLLLITETAVSQSSNPVLNIQTSEGLIVVELDNGPLKTTENFVNYALSGFYDGTIFHRDIKGFMIQGGGFTPDMKEKTSIAPAIQNEGSLCLPNTRGSIAMARTSDPHSATGQFFINTAENTFLNYVEETVQGYGYCSFGSVIEGMEVVDIIESMPTTTVGMYKDVPVTPIIIESVTLVESSEKLSDS